jgi:hypothetical protein
MSVNIYVQVNPYTHIDDFGFKFTETGVYEYINICRYMSKEVYAYTS